MVRTNLRGGYDVQWFFKITQILHGFMICNSHGAGKREGVSRICRRRLAYRCEFGDERGACLGGRQPILEVDEVVGAESVPTRDQLFHHFGSDSVRPER